MVAVFLILDKPENNKADWSSTSTRPISSVVKYFVCTKKVVTMPTATPK